MKRARVLVADDSAVARRLLSEAIESDPSFELVGAAMNGRMALARIAQSEPDVLVLDLEMPELDGLATLRELQKLHPRLPVLMFSSLTQKGAAATLEALTLGASDYLTKPSATGGTAVWQQVRDELLMKLRALCKLDPQPEVPALPASPPPLSPRSNATLDLVCIGASTGGPNALAEVLGAIGGPPPVPIVIVQHMPPVFTQMLAERFAAQLGLQAAEGRDGAKLVPGSIWVAPGDHHVTVERKDNALWLRTNQGPPENFCRPAVDVLFRSVAVTIGARALGVVLTGMGQDGLRGASALRAAGGSILVQDEATSVVWGMPGFVARAGLAEAVLPLSQLGPEIAQRLARGRSFGSGGKRPG